MKTDLIFLEIGKKDLEAAKYLFDRGLYCHSVFYLQQSIEKSVKSFGIWNKTITETEAKNAIGHKAWKVYSIIFNEFKDKVVKLGKGLEIFPKLKEVTLIKELEIDELKNKLGEYQKIFPDEDAAWNISLSKEELQNILSEIDKLRDELGEGFSRKIEIDEKEIEGLRKELYQLLNVLSEINPIPVEGIKREINKVFTPQVIADILEKLSKPLPELLFCYSSLFYLSLIFSPHATKSRYPQNNLNPLEVYNEKMPVIKMLDIFMKIIEEILEKLNHIYVEMPRVTVKK